MSQDLSQCGRCPFPISERVCRNEEGKSPPFCPTINQAEIIEKSVKEYQNPEVREMARQASIQEGEGYGDRDLGYEKVKPIKPRIVEIVEFAHRMNYRRLGLVFCVGLRREAKVVERFLSSHGFEVVSVICKAGRTPKETIGIRDEEKVAPGSFESMCNPIMQALVVNEEQTELNVLMGLCVGHDSIFLKYAQAPCTIFAVKDRVLGHNPLAAVYNIDSYYRHLKKG